MNRCQRRGHLGSIHDIVETDQVAEWRDFAHNNWKNITKARAAMQPEFAMTAVVSDGAASLAFDGGGDACPGGVAADLPCKARASHAWRAGKIGRTVTAPSDSVCR